MSTVYTIISLSARSIFHAYLAAILLYPLLTCILNRVKISVFPLLLILLALISSTLKEVVDYLLARPEALGTLDNMNRNLVVLIICVAGYTLALHMHKKGVAVWPLVTIAVTICISLVLSFITTQTLIPIAAPVYKSFFDVVSFTGGGYFFYCLMQRTWKSVKIKYR